MERRVLLAVFLSFLVLYAYQALVGPPPVPVEDSGSVASEAPSDTVEEGPAAAEPLAPPSGSTPSTPVGRLSPVESPEPNPIVGESAQRDIVVESDAFRAVFSNRGGELISWQLKDYLDQGRPVELIPRDLPADEPWPFSLVFDTEDLTRLAHAGLYVTGDNDIRINGVAQTLDFEYHDASGLHITKRFRFDPARSPYVMDVSVEATSGNDPLHPTLRWGPALGGVERSSSGAGFRQGPRGLIRGQLREAGGLLDVDVLRLGASAIAPRPIYEGQFDYVGVDNHYFIAVALPGQSEAVVRYRAVPLPPNVPDGEPRELIAFDLALSPDQTNVAFFIGPKDFDILAQALPQLAEAIDFGWLSVLVVPLHQSLKWVYGWVGNYGFSIIVVTLLINLIILPLRHKSVVSMRKMQEIQPEMKAIQDRYAHLKATDPDKQKMNQEIMALYRERGVNPVSGCLPMVLTMPILFAFYRLLSMSIELRGAPFVGWITDLSVHDPYYITPLIMGASMVAQQRLTPSQGDPTQQRIMMLMPVVFTVMFLWAPSGLVVYWLTSNLIGIAQQVGTNRIIGPPKQRTVRPPAERRAKGNVERKASGNRGSKRRSTGNQDSEAARADK